MSGRDNNVDKLVWFGTFVVLVAAIVALIVTNHAEYLPIPILAGLFFLT